MPNARIDVKKHGGREGGVGVLLHQKIKFMMRQRSLNHPGREKRIRILDMVLGKLPFSLSFLHHWIFLFPL